MRASDFFCLKLCTERCVLTYTALMNMTIVFGDRLHSLMNTSPFAILLIVTFLMTMYLFSNFAVSVVVCDNLQEHAIQSNGLAGPNDCQNH